MAKNSLSSKDVERLLATRSADARAQTAARIAADFDRGAFTETERKIAEDIFRLLVRDAEIRVRQALSDQLKENSLLPRDVAVALARDVHSVSLPVLELSEVLTDADLIEIIGMQDLDKQVAISSRRAVSEVVSDAIVSTENERAVVALVLNEGAQISEKSFGQVVESLGHMEDVQNAMLGRSGLPIGIAERLVTLVSENMRAEIAKRFELSTDMLTDIILQTRERAVLSLSGESDEQSLEALVRQLNARGRLTPSIILRALCMGDSQFFAMAMAELAGVPMANAQALIHDQGTLGLKAIYEKSGLPESYFPAIRAAVDVAGETAFDGRHDDRARFARRMIERILTQYDNLGVKLEADDLDYLLVKMNSLPSEIQDRR